MFGEEPLCPFVVFGHQSLDLEIDLQGDWSLKSRLVAALGQEKSLLLFRPNVKGPSFSLMPHSQTIFLARSVARSMIVPRSGRDVLQNEFFGHTPAHENGKLVVEELLRIVVPVIGRQLHRHAQAPGHEE